MCRSVVALFASAGLLITGPVWAGNTITVNDIGDNTTAGDGKCTLREAIANANAAGETTSGDCIAGTGTGDTIVFSLTLPATITLTTNMELLVTQSVTITGPGADQLAIDGNHTSRVFHVTAGMLTLSNMTIRNASQVGAWPSGGGLLIESAAATLTNCALSGNSADYGGGIFNDHSSVVTLTNTTLSGNWASDPGGGGVGIFNWGTATLTNVTIFGANYHGARYGGGIYNYYATATLINVTLSGNGAWEGGGGIFNYYSGATLANVTLSGNGAYSYGGAIANVGGTLTLTNTIVATSGGGDCWGGVTSNGHNLDDDGSCFTGGTDLPNTPPKLAPLGNYGGPTQTMALCTGVAVPDASCTGVSPALNAGDNSACPSTDQRGFTRPQPSGGTCDIGAYEVGCGDDVLDAGEQCDSGDSNSNTVPDACRTNCANPHCGDEVTDTGEQCDDGNTINNDDCTNVCKLPLCGDGILHNLGTGTEQCDNGSFNSDNAPCTAACAIAQCGDGLLCSDSTCTTGPLNGPEECDNGAGNSLSGACLPACQMAANDHDGDGVSNGTEANGPNNGDGNCDGTPDSLQANVASLPEATSSNYVTVVTSGGTCGPLQHVQTLGTLHPAADPNFAYPFGMVGFTVPCDPQGGTVHVMAIFHGQTTVPPGVVYRKYGPLPPNFNHPQYYTLPNVHFSVGQCGSTSEMALMAAFDITDGAVGDGTGQDGFIVDPGGPAIPIHGAVPLASPVGVTLLVLVLSGLGLLRARPAGA